MCIHTYIYIYIHIGICSPNIHKLHNYVFEYTCADMCERMRVCVILLCLPANVFPCKMEATAVKHIFMYTHICTYTFTDKHTCIHANMCMYTYTPHTYTHICLYTYIYVCPCRDTYPYVYIDLHIYFYFYMYTYKISTPFSVGGSEAPPLIRLNPVQPPA